MRSTFWDLVLKKFKLLLLCSTTVAMMMTEVTIKSFFKITSAIDIKY